MMWFDTSNWKEQKDYAYEDWYIFLYTLREDIFAELIFQRIQRIYLEIPKINSEKISSSKIALKVCANYIPYI